MPRYVAAWPSLPGEPAAQGTYVGQFMGGKRHGRGTAPAVVGSRGHLPVHAPVRAPMQMPIPMQQRQQTQPPRMSAPTPVQIPIQQIQPPQMSAAAVLEETRACADWLREPNTGSHVYEKDNTGQAAFQ